MTDAIQRHECKRCGHSWFPRSLQRPALCPKCNSARWNEPKPETKDKQKQSEAA